jgi:hypothetical protein
LSRTPQAGLLWGMALEAGVWINGCLPGVWVSIGNEGDSEKTLIARARNSSCQVVSRSSVIRLVLQICFRCFGLRMYSRTTFNLNSGEYDLSTVEVLFSLVMMTSKDIIPKFACVCVQEICKGYYWTKHNPRFELICGSLSVLYSPFTVRDLIDGTI